MQMEFTGLFPNIQEHSDSLNSECLIVSLNENEVLFILILLFLKVNLMKMIHYLI